MDLRCSQVFVTYMVSMLGIVLVHRVGLSVSTQQDSGLIRTSACDTARKGQMRMPSLL